MNVRNVITFLTLLFLPAVAFADVNSARVEIISGLLNLIQVSSYGIGLTILIASVYKMKLLGEQGHKNGISVCYVGVFAGFAIMNVETWFSVFSATLFNTDGICYQIAKNVIDTGCFSTETSGLTGELLARIEKLSNNGTAKVFLANIQIIIGIFQIIGTIYFAVGANGLKEVANGSAQNGYGKPITIMFAAALIVDIPHTAMMAIETLGNIGINF